MSDYNRLPGRVTVSPGVLDGHRPHVGPSVPGVQAVGRMTAPRSALLRGRAGTAWTW